METDVFSRAHPAVSFAFFLLVLLLTMVLMHPMYLLLSLLGAAAYLVALRGRQGLRLAAAAIPVFLVLTVLSPLLSPLLDPQGGRVLLTVWGGRYITVELVCYGAALAAMFTAVLLWFFCYSHVMTSDKFTALFAPLLPVVSLMLMMVLRLVPAYGRKARQISAARRCVGLGAGGTKRDRLRGSAATLAALTAWALESGIITADSMRCRGYGAARRTNFRRYRFSLSDGVVLTVLLGLAALVAAGMAAGYTRATYVPAIYLAGSNTPLGAAALIAWGVLLFLPTLLYLWEDLTWRILRSTI